jgi:hypothetical protein
VYLGTQLCDEGGATRQLSRHLISCKSVPLSWIAALLTKKVSLVRFEILAAVTIV